MARQPLWGFEFFISQGELGVNTRFEYNRVFTGCFELETYGGIQLNSRLGLKSGLAAGALGPAGDFNAFTQISVWPLLRLPVLVNFNYSLNTMPDYQTAIHSLIPYFTLNWLRLGLSLGVNFRYTRFERERPFQESILVFSLSYMVFSGERARFGIKYANFSDFFSNNMGSYSLSLEHSLRLSRSISLRNEIILYQTGSVALAANFYGIGYKGGIVLQW
ncbi:MAG: hypothetical protein LBD37_09980 [Treponema sp.]|jgi:hypothetical protein|nr:hypothetical protein [Treponema sp.]